LKNFILIVTFIFAITLFAAKKDTDVIKMPSTNIEKCDMVFKNIAKKRVGPSDEELSKVPSPFVNEKLLRIIRDENVTKKKRLVLHLYGIMNNRAKINKKWYKLMSKVYGYRLVKINDLSVVLKNKKKKIELFLRKKNDKINISKNF